MGEINWTVVSTGLVSFALGNLVSWFARGALEMRRRIRFSAPKVYFGPACTYNSFMGRNYPSDHSISLECSLRFFSEKTQVIGLHDFQLEFCRTSLFGPVVEFAPATDDVYWDLKKNDGPHMLDTLELPPRQFISLDLTTFIDPDNWEELRRCTLARLRCGTPEGRSMRFRIGAIEMPAMPAHGLDGMKHMSVQLTHANPHLEDWTAGVVIAASRLQETMDISKYIKGEDKFYWNGDGWAGSKNAAKLYRSVEEARAEGEAIKIWDIVPNEWLQDRKES
jgi:hypothetical protein